MDGLKRQILYKKSEQIETGKSHNDFSVIKTDEPKKELTAKEIIEQKESSAEKILKWIKSHTKFKYSIMCKEVGLDAGNFSKMIKADKINLPIEKLLLIEEKLKEYGY